jgi:hypothetical protein
MTCGSRQGVQGKTGAVNAGHNEHAQISETKTEHTQKAHRTQSVTFG